MNLVKIIYELKLPKRFLQKINTFKGHNETRHVGITENTVAGYNG